MSIPMAIIAFIALLVSTAFSKHDHPVPVLTAKSWCEQTPYPQPCQYLLTNNPKYDRPIYSKANFFKISLNLALDSAVLAQTKTYNLGLKCRNELEKAAWADCLELYESSIQEINKTLDPYTKTWLSALDAQTWLSAALTNLETCKEGFIELGFADYVMRLVMSNNVTKLITNALSLNEQVLSYAAEPEPRYENGFPNWLNPGDHKFLQHSSVSPKPNLVVAQDGSGNYTTLAAAIAAAAALKRSGHARFVIYIKEGTYQENVEIGKKLKNIMLTGDGIGKTIITGRRSVGGGSTSFKSATVAADGNGFIARGITFKNTAGPQNQQAVAFRSSSYNSVLYQCSFEGYQHTLYVHSQTQFYRECDIYGTVDFIFGNAAVVLQKCNIYLRNPPHKTNTITAQGRTTPNEKTGISIHNCNVTAAAELKPVQGSVRTYLGRPWKEYSTTVFMKTFLDGLIDPNGWMPWNGNFALDTLYFGEYANTGAGSSTARRVNWTGYHVITSAREASKFSVGKFLGTSWIPEFVPLTSGV